MGALRKTKDASKNVDVQLKLFNFEDEKKKERELKNKKNNLYIDANTAELLILKLLKETPRFQNELKQIILEECSSLDFKESEIYGAINKLKSEGLIKGRVEASPRGGYIISYSIKKRGEASLEKRSALYLANCENIKKILKR